MFANMWLQTLIVLIFIINSENSSYKRTAKILEISPTENSAIIEYICNTNINCLVKIEVLCLSEWCKNQKQYLTCSDIAIPCKVENLLPFTEYNFTFSSCISDGNCFNIAEPKIVKTNSSVPFSVRDPWVYSKNESLASLRWKRPYPPTGNLENYRVRTYFDDSIRNDTFNVTSCFLWPDYDCVTLRNLQPGKKYSVYIEAKNRESVYGEEAHLRFATKKVFQTKTLEAPRNLTIQWTLNNDLELRWAHSNATNEIIQSFKINLSPKNYSNKDIHKSLKVNKHLASYYYKIGQEEILPSTDYEINISAYNGRDGKNLTILETSPPEIPILQTSPAVYRTEDEITVDISLEGLKEDYLNNYKLFIFLSKHKRNEPISVPKILQSSHLNLTGLELFFDCTLDTLDHLRLNFGQSNRNCKKNTNFSVESHLSYNVTMILTLSDKNKTSVKIICTSLLEPSQNHYPLIILLIAVLIITTIILSLVYFPYLYVRLYNKVFYTPVQVQ